MTRHALVVPRRFALARSPLGRLAANVGRWYLLRRDERHLGELSDALLKDIGIARGEIPRVVREGRGGRNGT